MNQASKRKEHLEYLEHFNNLIKQGKIYPPHTEYRAINENGEKKILIEWKLNNDPERPNKPSKIIKIVFPQEFIDDYSNFQQNKAQRIDNEIIALLKQHYTKFDPSHNNLRTENPPIEELLMTLSREDAVVLVIK